MGVQEPARAVVGELPDGRPVVSFLGELDELALELHEDLLKGFAAGGDLVIDLRGVSFCDSSGVRLLLRAQKVASHGGHKITLIAKERSVPRVLRVMGLLDRFEVVPNLLKASPQNPE